MTAQPENNSRVGIIVRSVDININSTANNVGDPGVPKTPAADANGVLIVRILAQNPAGDFVNNVVLEPDVDGIDEDTVGLAVVNFPLVFNGGATNNVDYDRIRSISIANDQANLGIQAVGLATQWSESDTPAANTQPVATRAAAGVGVANICNSISGALSGAAASGAGLTLQLLDGAAVIWEIGLELPLATQGYVNFAISGLSIMGTSNTAMILQLSAAPGAGVTASVAMSGHIAARG